MINCFICGSWIKPNKSGTYRCPKCKARWKKDSEGNIIRISDTKTKKDIKDKPY